MGKGELGVGICDTCPHTNVTCADLLHMYVSQWQNAFRGHTGRQEG